jgi:hypothetical protein
MELPLTKTLEVKDYDALQSELSIVDQVGIKGQHETRHWEYAMGLAAVRQWKEEDPKRGSTRVGAVDVGGAGSNFSIMLGRVMLNPAAVVDPEMNIAVEEITPDMNMSSYVVTSISVVEHVEDEWKFLSALDRLVRPGGLLFLTMDIADGSSGDKDTAHFHWMRKRIYTPHTWMEMARRFTEDGAYKFLGEQDFSYNGNQLYGSYSFASLALVKRG